MIDLKTQLDVDKIQQDLNQLSDELKSKAVRAGVAKVAGSGVKLLRQYAPEKTGQLKKSMGRRQLSKTAKARLGYEPDQVVMLAGPNRKINSKYSGRIANILEGGSKKYEINAGKQTKVSRLLKSLGQGGEPAKVLSDGRRTYGTKMVHPGIRPMRFMHRADTQNQSNAQHLFHVGVQGYLKRKKLLR